MSYQSDCTIPDFLFSVFSCAIEKSAGQMKDEDVCVKLPHRNYTYSDCRAIMQHFVGGVIGGTGVEVSTVFEGTYPLILRPYTEEQLDILAK